MGIKDQFQDKADRLREQAQKAVEAEGGEKEARAPKEVPKRSQESFDKVRDQFDDRS